MCLLRVFLFLSLVYIVHLFLLYIFLLLFLLYFFLLLLSSP